MRTRLATVEDIPRLRDIWRLCFPGDESYVALFFRCRFRPEEAMVVEMDSADGPEVVAMLYMLPAQVGMGGPFYPAAYLYAVATHPQYQGHGCSTLLLEGTHRHLADTGHALSFLAPAGKSLFDFYGKRGFATAFSTRDYELPVTGRPAGRITPVDPEAYRAARETAFARLPLFVGWPTDAIVHQQQISRLGGGDVCLLETTRGTGMAIVEKDGDVLFIHELIWPQSPLDLTPAVALLLHSFGAGRAKVRMPISALSALPSTVTPRGMARWYITPPAAAKDFTDGYLALIMD